MSKSDVKFILVLVGITAAARELWPDCILIILEKVQQRLSTCSAAGSQQGMPSFSSAQ